MKHYVINGEELDAKKLVNDFASTNSQSYRNIVKFMGAMSTDSEGKPIPGMGKLLLNTMVADVGGSLKSGFYVADKVGDQWVIVDKSTFLKNHGIQPSSANTKGVKWYLGEQADGSWIPQYYKTSGDESAKPIQFGSKTSGQEAIPESFFVQGMQQSEKLALYNIFTPAVKTVDYPGYTKMLDAGMYYKLPKAVQDSLFYAPSADFPAPSFKDAKVTQSMLLISELYDKELAGKATLEDYKVFDSLNSVLLPKKTNKFVDGKLVAKTPEEKANDALQSLNFMRAYANILDNSGIDEPRKITVMTNMIKDMATKNLDYLVENKDKLPVEYQDSVDDVVNHFYGMSTAINQMAQEYVSQKIDSSNRAGGHGYSHATGGISKGKSIDWDALGKVNDYMTNKLSEFRTFKAQTNGYKPTNFGYSDKERAFATNYTSGRGPGGADSVNPFGESSG